MDRSTTPALEPTEEIERIYHRLRHVIPEALWSTYTAHIAAILKLKAERQAVILAHNYQTPEIFHAIADLTGDSLALAREAANSHGKILVVCGVHFMAETAKLLNPSKTVLIPDLEAGCSLAASITAEDVRMLRRQYPGAPVVTYVNTSAAVKAESDICCTSANAVQVVESLGAKRVIFLPDEYLGRYVAGRTKTEIITWKGRCEVHEKFTVKELRHYRNQFIDLFIVAHPECPPDVLAESDYVGSTTEMIREIARRNPSRVLMATECSMSDNAAVEFPQTEFIRHYNQCPHMKKITLAKVLNCLQSMQHVVEVEPEIAEKAELAVRRMLELDAQPVCYHGGEKQ